jgi:hypothetical protein
MQTTAFRISLLMVDTQVVLKVLALLVLVLGVVAAALSETEPGAAIMRRRLGV